MILIGRRRRRWCLVSEYPTFDWRVVFGKDELITF
jgi:hypothetical protein